MLFHVFIISLMIIVLKDFVKLDKILKPKGKLILIIGTRIM